MLPLRALTRANMGLLMFHHPGKADTRVGLAARGSSALLGHVDISIDMRQPGGNPGTRRRRFFALSRFGETPRQLLMDLNADGVPDYLLQSAPSLCGTGGGSPQRLNEEGRVFPEVERLRQVLRVPRDRVLRRPDQPC